MVSKDKGQPFAWLNRDLAPLTKEKKNEMDLCVQLSN